VNQPPEFKLVLSDKDLLDLPKEYRFRPVAAQCMYLLKERGEDSGQLITGLNEKGDLNPIMNGEYREFMKKRSVLENTPKRKTMMEEKDVETQLGGYLAPVADHPDKVECLFVERNCFFNH